MTIKKVYSAIGNLFRIYITAYLPILVRCKTKGAVGAVWPYCAIGNGSHMVGDGQTFLKTSAPLSLINTYRMSLLLAGSSIIGLQTSVR
jgi:hypothetical protein